MLVTHPTTIINGFEDFVLWIGNEPSEDKGREAIKQAKALIHEGADPFTPVSIRLDSLHLDAFDPEELTLGRLAFGFN